MKNDKDKENWNNYFIDNTNILKNNLNIIDKEKLYEAEKDTTSCKHQVESVGSV